MPLQATSGAASYDAFGGGVPSEPNYIESVFSCFLYTGTGSAQTITNGIDLSTKGGLVWSKSRSGTRNNVLIDTQRGVGNCLFSNLTSANDFDNTTITSFNTSGYSIGSSAFKINTSGENFASWTFRKQPKFFDVITWTGTGGTGDRAISHNLAAVPAAFTIKPLSFEDNWQFRHKDLPADTVVFLNLTNAATSAGNRYSSTPNTATTFYVNAAGAYNLNGETYVAYLFAHDAGGFGLTGTDNVISCGSFTTNGSGNATVSLGYEPQWVMTKCTGTAGGDDNGDWRIVDSMRGFPAPATNVTYAASSTLFPNTSGAEAVQGFTSCNSTGFGAGQLQASKTYIYIAIRRGPMKVPTSGTSVFAPNISSGSVGTVITTNFPVDMQINSPRDIAFDKTVVDRLRGVITTPTDTLATRLRTNLTNAEGDNFYSRGWNNTGFQMPSTIADTSDVFWSFRRAPSFFDVVCYTGTGTAGQTYTHNLGVVPELMIVKGRSIAEEWNVYFGNNTNYLKLNRNDVPQTATTRWNDTSPTSSVFSVGTSNWVNASGSTYVAYLFASLAGVSKVFSYTGNGSSQTINCGFTGGARFVLIKRTDAIGNWYVWDSARGIVSGNDPYLSLNTTAAEVTTDDSVDTDNTGFIVNQVAATNVNVSSATYIGIAIA